MAAIREFPKIDEIILIQYARSRGLYARVQVPPEEFFDGA
jgi:hypothetical protein